MTDEFTYDEAARKLIEVGEGVLREGDFTDDGWSSIAIVAEVEGAIMVHGFKYYPDGDIKPGSTLPFETSYGLAELADIMAKQEGNRWKACLIQIAKPEMKMKMQYEYKDGTRWSVTPANIEEMREKLRPA